jgi:hypothetical protein
MVGLGRLNAQMNSHLLQSLLKVDNLELADNFTHSYVEAQSVEQNNGGNVTNCIRQRETEDSLHFAG